RHRPIERRKATESLLADEVPGAEGSALRHLEISFDRRQRVPVRPFARPAGAGEHEAPRARKVRGTEVGLRRLGRGDATRPGGFARLPGVRSRRDGEAVLRKFLLLLAAIPAAVCAQPSMEQAERIYLDQSLDREQKLVAAARKEGTVSLYTSMQMPD